MRHRGIGIWKACAAAVWVALYAVARGQSFNIDLDVQFGPPEGGRGVPSSSFGAASGSAGVWNNIAATGNSPTFLKNLDGTVSSVVFSGPNGGIGNGFNNPNLFGDFRLLMSDGRSFDSDTWSFSGLQNGRYSLFTYAVSPSGNVTSNAVVASGSVTSNPQTVTGPILNNQFALGITHCVHEINVSSGSLAVSVSRSASAPAYLNGFQLVAVPEPSLMLSFGLGSLFLGLRKRR